MLRFIFYLIIFLTPYILYYLFVSFILLSFDITGWDGAARFFVIIPLIISIGITSLFVIDNVFEMIIKNHYTFKLKQQQLKNEIIEEKNKYKMLNEKIK